MRPHIAVDAGRTWCRAMSAAGALVAETPSRGTLADPQGPQLVAAGVGAAISSLSSSKAGTLTVAAAGALTRPDAAIVLADLLARDWPGPVVVTSDVVAAHASALAGRPGVVLVAGTGAAALAIDSVGGCALVDGGGYLAGDHGSGFAIGQAGLAAALRHVDGRPGGSAALAAAAVARFGLVGAQSSAQVGTPLRAALAALHDGEQPVQQVAAFAHEVAAAARAGDALARGIWFAAASELAVTVAAALHRQPSTEVALVGALFDVEDLLTTPLRKEIADGRPHITVRVAAADALLGAIWLAEQAPGAYEPMMTRSRDPQPDDNQRTRKEG